MESKSQKAALAHVKDLTEEVINEVDVLYKDRGFENGYPISKYTAEDLYHDVEKISESINKYGLGNELLNDVIAKIYDALMKAKHYEIAASLAKKYGL